MTAQPPEPPTSEIDKLGLVQRVGLFVLLGFLGVLSFPILMQFVPAKLFVTSTLSTFAAGAVANAITVRIYERGRLGDFGLGKTPTAAKEFGLGAAVGAGAAISLLLGLALADLLATGAYARRRRKEMLRESIEAIRRDARVAAGRPPGKTTGPADSTSSSQPE